MPDLGHIPGAVYIPQCMAIRLFWRLPNTKTAFNVLHCRIATPPSLSQAYVDAFFTDVLTAYTASGLPGHQDVETRLTNVGLRNMARDTTGFGFGEWVSANTGASGSAGPGGGPLPAQISFVVSLKTGFSGQANRGRVYIPGFHSSADDGNGSASDDTAADCVDFITRIGQMLTARAMPLAIAHPARAAYTSPKPPFTEHEARPAGVVNVTGITKLNNVWDTQRLRSHL